MSKQKQSQTFVWSMSYISVVGFGLFVLIHSF
jgi:hypothetical protein